MLLLVLIAFLFYPIEGQRRRYEPYWISTITQAETIGVDLKRFMKEHCSAEVIKVILRYFFDSFQNAGRRIHYLNLNDIDPEFGTTQAETLMRQYAYIAIQLGTSI